MLRQTIFRESSVLAGKPIRQCMYALLDITKVVEYIRCGLNIKGDETTREELNGEFRDVTIAMVECLGHHRGRICSMNPPV